MTSSCSHFPKKKVWYAPGEKLLAALALILAGGTAMNQLETIIHPDKAVQRAFGLTHCASSGDVQKLFNRGTPETVSHLQKANEVLYQQHGQALHHHFFKSHLILDLDLTGLVTSQSAEGSTKGYFAKQRGRWGRQLCRTIATPYQEIVCQALVPGTTQSQVMLKPALQQVQHILNLSKLHRRKTLVRWDAGFGTDKNFNWVLSQDYQVLGKVYAHKRVRKLCQSVTEWFPCMASPGRQFGLATQPHRYARKTRQIVVRTPKKLPSTEWAYGALVTTFLQMPLQELVTRYDARGGGIETDFRSDRQGLGLAKRRKHRMAAQQMLIHLAERAHNLLIWTAQHFDHPIKHYGILKLVRDVCQINGYLLVVDEQPVEIGLNRYHPLAYEVCKGFNALFDGFPHMKAWNPVTYIKEPEKGSSPIAPLL